MAADAKSEATGATIRAFCEADAGAVGAIAQEVSELANWKEANYRDSLNWQGIVALVSEDRGKIAGFVFGRQVTDEAEIYNLAVRVASRRRGAGAALLGAALGEFRARRVRRVFLEVRESNEAAMAFYGRHGFLKTGRRLGYYREPDEAAVLMEMRLGD